MRTGDLIRRADTSGVVVAVLSNPMHLAAGTGRVVVCPFVEGLPPDEDLAGVVRLDAPSGILVPELVHWLPVSALPGPAIGQASADQVRSATDLVMALIRDA